MRSLRGSSALRCGQLDGLVTAALRGRKPPGGDGRSGRGRTIRGLPPGWFTNRPRSAVPARAQIGAVRRPAADLDQVAGSPTSRPDRVKEILSRTAEIKFLGLIEQIQRE